jgi:hypothetical protein
MKLYRTFGELADSMELIGVKNTKYPPIYIE